MQIRGLRPEVEQRLREVADAASPAGTRPIDDVISAYMAGARDKESRELAKQVVAEHREFFDLIGDQ
jgi:hypothetical protein